MSVNQKLLEVPRYCVAVSSAGLLGAKPLIQLTCTVAVDVNLGEHRERDVVLCCCKRKDLCVGAGLLPGELITGEGQNVETSRLVVFKERTQTCVLGRKPSSTRDVDDQADLILVLGKTDGIPGNGIHRDVIKC